MALGDLLRSGIALANSLTADLQPTVIHQRWSGNTPSGGAQYAPAVARQALVERKQKLVKDAQGREILSAHVISFIYPIDALGTPGRKEPIDPRDRFTLPDGTTGPILSVDSFVDRATGAGFYQVVYLG